MDRRDTVSCFDFLSNSTRTKDYYDKAIVAENNLYEEPSVTITQLGILLESLLKQVCFEENIRIKDRENLENIIKLLYDRGIINKTIASSCHKIRINNNMCKHDNISNVDMAKISLLESYNLCRWLFKTYMGCLLNVSSVYVIPTEKDIKEKKIRTLRSEISNLYSEEIERARLIKLNSDKIIKTQAEENKALKQEIAKLTSASGKKDDLISSQEIENKELRKIIAESKQFADEQNEKRQKSRLQVDESDYLPSFNLNDNQLDAVLALDGYVKTVAGPGTGKTHTLTCRYVHLVRQKQLSPTEVLCITFTNKAAKEMRERIEKVLGDQDYSMICTFHGFCYKIFSQHCGLINFPDNFVVIDDDDSEGFIEEILDKSEFDDERSDKEFSAKKLKQYIKYKKEKERSIYTSCLFNEDDGFLKNQITRTLNKKDAIYYYFLQKQRQENALQFDDLHNALAFLLSKQPHLIKKLQTEIKYIMVDEFQDINGPQYRMVKLLSEENHNLFVVGDANQTIYSWRGANIRYFDNFQNDFPNVKTFTLVKNYRSTAQIISSAESSISNNIGETYQLETITTGDQPIFKVCENRQSEVDWVCSRISNLLKSGANPKDIAVIYRKNEIAGYFQKKLHELKIPFVIFGGKGLFRTDEVKTIICYLQMILKDNDFAFKKTVSMPPRGIGVKKIEKLNVTQIEEECSLFEALKKYVDIPDFARTQAKEYISIIEELRTDADNIPVSSLILKLVESIKLKDYFADGGGNSIENIVEFIRVVEDLEEDNINEGKPTMLLAEFLDLLATLDENSSKTNDCLKLMSAHASKGLEFNNVFICGLEEGTFPSVFNNFGNTTSEKFFEERRLFFVALTRAKSQLYLSASRNISKDPNDNEASISRFVYEIQNTITMT